MVDMAADDAVDALSARLGCETVSNSPMKFTAFFTLSFAHCDSDQ